MQILVPLTVNVILTMEEVGQAFYDAAIVLPNVELTEEQRRVMEIDTLEAILKQYDGDPAIKDLIKISLCYNVPSGYGPDTQFGQHLQFLTRDMAKYYFQPNQRSTPEMLLMERVPGLAIRTPNFA